MKSLSGHFARLFCSSVLAATVAVFGAVSALAAPYAAFVIDAASGEVLYSENAESRLHPASLTKMMTLYLTFQAIEQGEISLDTKVKVSKHAAGQPPSRLGLRAGQKIEIRYLIRAAAIKSANDAATALCEAVGGNEADFARRMTRTAEALGMTATTFKNCNGLTAPGHLSSARDMTILGRHLFYDFPQYYNLFSRRTVDAGLATVNNTNRKFLDAYEGADGIKTGYTVAAGFNLTASAQRGNVRLIATVLGGKSTADRNARMADLLDMGFAKASGHAPSNIPEPPPAEALMSDAAPADTGAIVTADTSMSTSPRPMARPGSDTTETVVAAAEAVDAMQTGIAGALAEAVEEPTLAEAALADLGGDEAAALTAQADQLAAAAVPAAALASADGVMAQPADMAGNAAIVAGMTDPANGSGTEIIPFQVASAGGMMVSPRPAQRAAPIYDDVAAPKTAEIATPEVIVPVSAASGEANWAVTVGQFPSRYEAERALLQTQLAESISLASANPQVKDVSGGYDARFAGLTQDQADLACRRLQARAITCFTLGP